MMLRQVEVQALAPQRLEDLIGPERVTQFERTAAAARELLGARRVLNVTERETPKRLSAVRNFLLSFLIILATVFFALGIILPVIRFTTVYVWTNEHSIATIILALYESNEYFLCAVVFAVSIFFPFLKLFYLLTLVTSPDLSPEFRRRSFSTMEWLGRYSMTDVMVLALMIFYVNSSGYTEAIVMPGVYFFAASALITMLAYGWANTVPPRSAAPAGEPAVGEIVTLPTNPARRHRPA